MHAEASDHGSTEPLFEQAVSPAGRLIGVVAGCLIAITGWAVDEALIVPLGLIVLTGALTVRASSTTVDHGAIVHRMASAPLRPGTTTIIPPERIRGIEVLHAYDSDAAPGRHDEYWVAVRLVDRRRAISLGHRHYDRQTAEAEASQLRAAIGRHASPGAELPLHLPATRSERLLLGGCAVVGVLIAWQALTRCGGRPIDDVWPLAAIALAAILVALGLAAAAVLTQGTAVSVRPATAHVELRRGIGWLGPRSSVVRFEDIVGVDYASDEHGGSGTVSLRLRDGHALAIHHGPEARETAALAQRMIAGAGPRS